MRKLKEVSAYLTEIFYFKIMNKISEDGVNIQEGKLVGYKSFVSANKCNTGQIVFLNQNIPRGVSYYLEQFGAELRYKFKGHNTHPHFTLLTKNEYSNFSEEIQKQIREEFKEQVVLVNVVGVVALSNPEEVILGLEVKMDKVNKWRKKYELSSISNPHISCCHLRKEVYDEILATIVFEGTGKRDKYIVWVKGGGVREIKTRTETKEVKKIEQRDQEERGKENGFGKSLVWVPGVGFKVAENIEEKKALRVEKKDEKSERKGEKSEKKGEKIERKKERRGPGRI